MALDAAERRRREPAPAGGSPTDFWALAPGAALPPPLPKMVTCAPSSPLSEVLALLGRSGKHRIYVLAGGRPVSVITATDVLRFMAAAEERSH